MAYAYKLLSQEMISKNSEKLHIVILDGKLLQ